MHQDVYNQTFDGEGSPTWAVCTDGVQSDDPPGRWSLEYGTAAAGIAFSHFWRNDVKGDLQGQFDRLWGDVAHAFRGDAWILGYDPYNEPFSKSLVRFGDEDFDAQLECFYTGTAHIGTSSHGAPALHCPRNDPAQGVIATILANDPHHLVFVEPDNFASRGFPTYLGSMNFPHLVYNVHIYCGARSPVTGNPTDIALCVKQDVHSLAVRAEDRTELASGAQRGGPAWFVTEFGASSDPSLLAAVTDAMDGHQVSWAYWAWRYYGDPTGSAAESLVMADGRLRSTAHALSRAYPQAVAGLPLSYGYEPLSGIFRLSYLANRRVHAPTVIFVPAPVRYPGGYCARASGALITSSPGSDLLEVQNRAKAQRVTVTVSPGACAK
jgi:endoglycosylceramidase